MSNLPKKHIIDKCVDKILKFYTDNGCNDLEVHLDYESKEFSISFYGFVPRLTLTSIIVNDGGVDRTFVFQVCQTYANCYSDDWLPSKTDRYLYIGETTKRPEKSHILYECDGMACKKPCSKECHHTTDITHAKNFKYENGIWIERRDYSPKNLYC